jgi:hypothetical protein
MQLVPILLSLITAATAIDIRFQEACDGGWSASCANINPGVCCSITGSTPIVLFAAVPNWNVETFASPYNDCSRKDVSHDIVHGDKCFHDYVKHFASGVYHIVNKKMARDEVEQPCQRVDTFYVEDGTKYSLTDLEDGQIRYLVCLNQCLHCACVFANCFARPSRL